MSSSVPDDPQRGGWRRLGAALRARPGRGQVIAALLCGLLAFGVVAQAHTTSGGGGVTATRTQDLLTILADLQGRADRLRTQIADLRLAQARLAVGGAGTDAALVEARRRAQTLGIVTGTIGARGPGVVLTVADPRGSVHADVLLDAIEELRDAGAEALQLSGVRVVASTALVDGSGAVVVDGSRIRPPYRLAAIGDPRTLASALGIPGGVLDTVAAQPGAHATVTTSPSVSVTALRPLTTPRYARPAATSSP
jgi:uncharacterized protein YlxW (UPF0749 family)